MVEWAQSFLPGVPDVVYVSGAFLLLSLCLRIRPAAALRQALMIGCGLVGVQVLSNFMFAVLVPVTANLNHAAGQSNMVLCTGMSTWFSAMMLVPFIIVIYPLGLLINRLLLRLRWTRTADVDFINYFCFLTLAIPVWLYTKNVLLCLGIFALFFIFSLKVADWTGPAFREFYQLEGISVMHHSAGVQALYCAGINWVLDHLPGINRINFTLGDIQKKLGPLSDPTLFCFLTGVVIGLLSDQEIGGALMVGFVMTILSVLFPKAIGAFMEGLSPITARLREWVIKGQENSEVYMGVDAAVVSGDPEVVALTALWMPVYIALHFLLPWSHVVPGPESFSVGMMVAVCLPFAGRKGEKGNVFRTLIMLMIFSCILMYTAGYVSSFVTQMYRETGGLALPEGSAVTTSGAYHAYQALVYYIFQLLGIAQ